MNRVIEQLRPRSRTAGNIILAAIALIGLLSLHARGEVFPSYGVQCDGPKDWQALPRDAGKRVARWVRLDSQNKPTHFLMVDTGKAADPTIEATAAAFAKQHDGRVEPKPTDVDGEHALRVVMPHAGRGIQPVEVIVTAHDGVLYLIMCGVEQAEDVTPAVEQVRASWKWLKRQPPTQLLHDRVVMEVPGGGGTRVSAPRCAAVVPGMKGAQPNLHLALFDASAGTDEALIMTQVAPMQAGVTFEQLVDHFRAGWNAKGISEAPMDWAQKDLAGRTVVSDVMRLKERDKSGKPLHAVWTLRQLDDDTIALINFTLMTDDPKEIESYGKFAGDFVKAVQKPSQAK